MKKHYYILQILKSYELISIFLLGIVSGMPLAILYTSLIAWLTSSNIPIEIVTTFAIARISYSLKPLWAPMVDRYPVPLLGVFGHRKSWLILCTILIALVLALMSQTKVDESLSLLYFLSITLGVLSATFDISYDALRIEKLTPEMQGLGAASAVLGYRIGLLITGAGALYFSDIISWSAIWTSMSLFFIIATIFIFFTKEDIRIIDENSTLSNLSIIIKPFLDFLTRDRAVIILLAIVFFKLGDAMLGVVCLPFYLELGFTGKEVATVVKLYGVIATLVGTYVGGFIIYKIGYFRGLVITAIAQNLTNLAFIWLHHQGADITSLMVAVSIENFAGGMGSAAMVAYLSVLCNKKYSATQYAMFTSCASLFNNTVTVYGGSLVKSLGWDNFFIFTVVLGIPGILLFLYLHKTQKNPR